MSNDTGLPSERLLVEAIRWLLQLDPEDPRNWRPKAKGKRLGEQCGQVQSKG